MFTLLLFAYLFVNNSYQESTHLFSLGNVLHVDFSLFGNILLRVLISILLIFGQALLVAQFIIKNKMSRNLSLIPGAVMALALAFFVYPNIIHPVLFANLAFLLSLSSLYQVYKKYNPIGYLFNSGFFLGLATLIYAAYGSFFIVIILGIFSLRSIKAKEVLQFIVGFLTPFFFLLVFAFYQSLLSDYWGFFRFSFTIPSIDLSNIESLIRPLVSLIIVFYLIFKQSSLVKKKKFDAIKKVELNFIFLLMGFISILFIATLTVQHLILISTPMAMLGGLVLEEKDNKITNEFLFIILIGLYICTAVNLFSLL